jgi:hypothetical protein
MEPLPVRRIGGTRPAHRDRHEQIADESRENAAHHMCIFHARQPLIEPAKRIREPLVVDAQDVQHRGV